MHAQVREVLPSLNRSLRDSWETLLDPFFWFLELQLLALEALLGLPLGAEQAAAASAAKSVSASVFLVDRPQSITIGRTIAALASLAALRDFWRSVRSSAGTLPAVVQDISELESLMLSPTMTLTEFERSAMIAKRVVDALLNTPQTASWGAVGRPIQEERDFLLSHTLYHVCQSVEPGSQVVAVLGAAHLPGVAQQFASFAGRGCSSHTCGEVEEVQRLSEVPQAPLVLLFGCLLIGSSATLAGRWMLSRHIRRRYGSTAARRFNATSIAFGAGFGGFGVFRARRQYNATRNLQLCRSQYGSILNV